MIGEFTGEHAVNTSIYDAIYAIGANFLHQGKYDKALIIFDGLMALEPGELKPAIAYGDALLLAGRAEMALSHFYELAKQFDLDGHAVLLTAKACVLLDKSDDAKKLLEMITKHEISATPENLHCAESMLTLCISGN